METKQGDEWSAKESADIEIEGKIDEGRQRDVTQLNHAQLLVGGVLFVVDDETIASFQSDFIKTLVDRESDFKKPDDGVYAIDADHECFSAFLHYVRYGMLPTVKSHKDDFVLSQADFWGIKGKVEAAMNSEKLKFSTAQAAAYKGYTLKFEATTACVHHNHREDDGQRRIHCVHCGNRDIDGRWHPRLCIGRHYTYCKSCNKDIKYKPGDLEWCHKCKLCTSCQTHECPSDDWLTTDYYYYHKSTKKLRDEAKAQLEIFDSFFAIN